MIILIYMYYYAMCGISAVIKGAFFKSETGICYLFCCIVAEVNSEVNY